MDKGTANRAAYVAGQYARQSTEQWARERAREHARERRADRAAARRERAAERRAQKSQRDSLEWANNPIWMGLYCSLCTTVTVISTGIYHFDNYAAEFCGAIPRAVRIPLDLVTPLVNCPPIIDNEPGWGIPLPWQNNDFNLDAQQQEVIATIVEVGQDVGASEQDIQIAIATCLVESQCKTGESVREKDHDSIGPFQQRPSQSWPDSEDPRVQARAFFTGHGTNKGLLDVDRVSNPGKAAQAVQKSAFPGRYAERMDEAAQILASFKSGSGGSSAESGSAFPVQGITFSSNESKYSGMSGNGVHLFGNKRDNGTTHRGYDVACNVGQPLIATESGTMRYYNDDPSGWGSGAFYIETADGNALVYGHGDRTASDGATVSAGEVVGKCNSKGRSSGPHLHFEIRPGGINGTPINPAGYLRGI